MGLASLLLLLLLLPPLLLLHRGCAVPPRRRPCCPHSPLDGCRTLMAAPMRGQHLLQMCPSLPQVRTSS
jgi:hypothetical protein